MTKTHWIDAACVGSSTPPLLQLVGVVPLLVTATGHGSRQKCNVNDISFPCSKPKGAKQVKGFQTGDLVRASGFFDIRTKGGRVQGISHRCDAPACSSDGYNYQFGLRFHAQASSR